MRFRTTFTILTIGSLAVAVYIMSHRQSTAGKWRNPFRKQTTVEKLAKEIDGLEEHIDTYGSVVAKHPSVWGEARLTKHRHEFEKEMAKELGKFNVTSQAKINRSDTAYLHQTLNTTQAAAVASSTEKSNVNTTLGSILPGGPSRFSFLNVNSASNPQASQTSSPTLTSSPTVSPTLTSASTSAATASAAANAGDGSAAAGTAGGGGGGGGSGVGLDPVVKLDQMKRYLDHLNEIRRVNESDDTVDAPGYSINLVRFPVSILPGKKTRTGYGAEITMSIALRLSDELLKTTFQRWVINDIVDLMTLPVLKASGDDYQRQFQQIAQDIKDAPEGMGQIKSSY